MDQSDEIDLLKQNEINQKSIINQQSEEIKQLQNQLENLQKNYGANLPILESNENIEYSNASTIEVKENHTEEFSQKVDHDSVDLKVGSNQNDDEDLPQENLDNIAQSDDILKEFNVLNLSDIEKADTVNESFDFIGKSKY